MSLRLAAIDIGSNTVKLLTAERVDSELRPVCELSRQTRLGQGVFSDGRLAPEAVEATAAAAGEFVKRARRQGAQDIVLFATSAAREARNLDALLRAVEGRTGRALRVLSQEEEAEWAFLGAASAPGFQGRRLLVVDIGGGSVECVAGEENQARCRASAPVGAVRLLERFGSAGPEGPASLPETEAFLEREIRTWILPFLNPCLAADPPKRRILAATGGTALALAAMEFYSADQGQGQTPPDCLDACSLSKERLEFHLRRLWAMPLEARRAVRGLPPERADVMPFGAAALAVLLRVFGLDRMWITRRGIRFGALQILLRARGDRREA